MNFSGPGESFQLLFEEPNVDINSAISLPSSIREIYGGDWIIPLNRQYRYSNFVISHDGKTSFSVLHHEGGGDISGFNRNDQWVMALTRARADAVTVGANTLRTEPDHIWSSAFIFPQESEAFAQLRLSEGRRPFPYQVLVTRSGDLNANAAVFADPQLDVIVATTKSGARKIRAMGLSKVTVLELGESDVDLNLLHERLEKEFGVMSVLCEGGPKFYAALVEARQIEEEFLTISPIVVGSSNLEYRPGLIDGLAFEPGNKFGVNLQSLRRAGNMLFLRSRYKL
jgi:riboflavin biosynthesis pyrimidine reductase